MGNPLPSATHPPADSGELLATLPRGPYNELRITRTTSRAGRPVVRLREWVIATFPDGSTGWIPRPGRSVSLGVEDGEVGTVAGVLGRMASGEMSGRSVTQTNEDIE